MGKGLTAILGGITAIIALILAIMGIYGIFAGSFPYESWDVALAASAEAVENAGASLGGQVGYFTFGEGGNAATVLITWLAILLSVTAAVTVTKREDDLLNEAADRLAEKYDSNG